MTQQREYSYDRSVKSDVSDELINVYVLRPLAGILVRILYFTPVTPNHVTVAAIVSGTAAAALYLDGAPGTTVLAGVCITLKDLLDSADGQLARAKQMYSRTGRFLDSIGDFLVNLFVFTAIGFTLVSTSREFSYGLLALMAFLGTTFRVSYHVYYHTSFLHTKKLYATNRITEEVQEQDIMVGGSTLFLQRVFQFIYGWQDRLAALIDRWCRGGDQQQCSDLDWFADRVGLRISGLLGLGTEMGLLTLCSVTNNLAGYLYFNVVMMNGILALSMYYRRSILRSRLTKTA
jgi:phosphatidylglycerophosphate synthase